MSKEGQDENIDLHSIFGRKQLLRLPPHLGAPCQCLPEIRSKVFLLKSDLKWGQIVESRSPNAPRHHQPPQPGQTPVVLPVILPANPCPHSLNTDIDSFKGRWN